MTPVAEPEYEAVVAGSGAGGGIAALVLCEAGLNVLLLERGRRYDFRTDYPMSHADWERHGVPFVEASRDTIKLESGAALDRSRPHLFSGTDRPRRLRSSFLYRRVLGLGGTTLHYQGEAHRFADYAFRPASEYGFGVDWPITYEALAPYYERVERLLGVAGWAGNPFKPARGAYPTPAHPLSPASRLVGEGAEALGWRLQHNSLALPTRSVDGRSPCRHTGGCTSGCIFGAKSSMDVSAIARAGRTGRLTIKTHARVLRLETRPGGGSVERVIYQHDGDTHAARARVYVLATGAVETPRVLLHSRSDAHPRGIGNEHDQVGRYFMETVLAAINVRFNRVLEAYRGPPIDARIWDMAHPDRSSREDRGGYALGVSSSMGGYQGPVSYALKTGGFGLAHKRAMRERFGRIVTLFGIAEQEPRAGNRITLSDERDEQDVPKVSVRTSHSEKDVRAIEGMFRDCDALAEASGAAEILSRRSTYDRSNASHVGGGCRMGRSPVDSVTDPSGRVHGLDNLYICDASVLPGQGAGDSPSLTIQALAWRTAAEVVRRLKSV